MSLLTPLRACKKDFAQRSLGDRVRRVFAGRQACFISSNCVGSRLSLLAGQPFSSPTVNLWIEPEDYLTFVGHIEMYRALQGDFTEDREASRRMGYPVAWLGDGRRVPRIKVYFQHFEVLDDAISAWRRRFARIELDRIILTFTDRDGATAEHMARFEQLPYPKIAFTRLPHPELPSCAMVPGFAKADQVGDLFIEWHRLAPVLTERRLRALSAHLH